jgi:hypothetical protein
MGMVAAVLFGLALVLYGLVLTTGQYNGEKERECQSRISNGVTQSQGNITIAVGDGLLGLREEDEGLGDRAAEDYLAARGALDEALRERDVAEETCRSDALLPF